MRLEGLPVVLLANYRGFSGGATDMFDRVLEYGAQIVETLTRDGPPVWVYIPPRGQLCGGAFVVVSPSINPDRLEMYMAPTARAGILEPIAQSKFLWRGDNPETGNKLAQAQDRPERLVHHAIVSGILTWGAWVQLVRTKLRRFYGFTKETGS
jgi:acetyl-CoA carboxylase carboxyltransferase component